MSTGSKGAFWYIFIFLFTKTYAALQSPCPDYFVFEPEKSEEDRWYGIMTLASKFEITGVILELHFDKPIIQLGNWFGHVASNSDHSKFTVKNGNKIIQANKPIKAEIFVVYDPYVDIPPPKLTKILLNGREICPRNEEQLVQIKNDDNVPTILVNINLPTCGTTIITTNPLITQGQHTMPGQWPWHTGIYHIAPGNKREYKCGGSLISEKHILTAAHCVMNRDTGQTREPQNTVVILGKYGFYTLGKDEQTPQISKITAHPNFSKTHFYNDIAIITLSDPVKLTDHVKPVCLWSEDIRLESVVNRTGTAVGWGRDHKNNDVTDLLMQAQMPVVETLTCIYTNRQFYSLFTNDNNFCAGFINGTSVCNGDSGGGLVFPKKGTSGINTVWQIRGIVSNSVPLDGFVCDPKSYVIFTDVAKYLDWINKVTS